MDDHLQSKVDELRDLVPTTMREIIEDREKTNRQNILVPIGILTGVYLQLLSSGLLLTRQANIGDFVSNFGSLTAASGFAYSRIARVKSIEDLTTCGVADLDRVLDEYQVSCYRDKRSS